jgi:sugar (pentulose or hexulose) kinase
MTDVVIGLDCSTTACKAIAWDHHGRVTAEGRASLPLNLPQPSWHEQPAESWWQATCEALQALTAQIDPTRCAALSISIQRETFVVADDSGIPLRPAMVWMDERSREILPELATHYGRERFHQEAGKPLSANLVPGKLAWLRQHEPHIFKSIRKVLDVHAFLAGRLTGEFITSWGCADPTGLFDMRRQQWNGSLMETLGLDPACLPAAVPPGAPIGVLSVQAARQTGLPAGLPLFAGLGDGQAAGLGVNITRPGDAYLNLGTAVVSGTVSPVYLTSPAFRTHYSGTGSTYFLDTVLLGGTYTISWLIQHFSPPGGLTTLPGQSPEEALEVLAGQVAAGAQGLLLVPYWNSAMNPYWDPGASGIVTGWRGHHGIGHLYRAILEGIAFEQHLASTGVEDATSQRVERYIAVGGGARSRLWRQILADVTGKPVLRADVTEASALGAGMLAAWGAGWYPDLFATAQAMAPAHEQASLPNPGLHTFYKEVYQQVYRHLFPVLQPYLDRLTALTEAQT